MQVETHPAADSAVGFHDGAISRWRETRRLDRLVTRYAGILLVVMAVVLASFSTLSYLDAQTRIVDGIRLDASDLLQLQIDQETAVRGYDDTGVKAFLQPFGLSQQPISAAVSSLRDRVSNNPEARAALDDFARIHDRWVREIAGPIITNSSDPRNEAREQAGKLLMDAARADIRTIDTIYAARYDRIMWLKLGIRYASMAIVIVSILLIAGTGYVSERRSLDREERLVRTLVNERDAETLRSEWRRKIIAMLAHDFRSSLGIILAYADMLQAFPEKRDDPTLYGGIRKAVHDLTAMSEEALLMARTANNSLNLHPHPSRIADIVNEAKERHSNDRQITVSESDELIMGDRAYLVRVFDNLIGNAIKYSPENTEVRVQIRRVDDDQIEVAISDCGPGIAPSDLPYVFEEFWRSESVSERSGSGIGLFIVKKIVDAHGGSAKIESRAGEGTTVRILLPAAPASESTLTTA